MDAYPNNFPESYPENGADANADVQPTDTGGTEAQFFLVPDNEAAERAVQEPENEWCRHQAPTGEEALYLCLSENSPIITLGRSGADILVPGGKGLDISRNQCAFEFIPETSAVILRDESSKHTTVVSDAPYCVPLNDKHQAVVAKGMNSNLGIGRNCYYQFKLEWISTPMLRFLNVHICTLGPQHPYDTTKEKWHYIKGPDFGYGSSGLIAKAVHVRSGNAIAIKKYSLTNAKQAIREIQRTRALKHSNILSIIDFEQDKDKKWTEIYTPLKEGTLSDLALASDVPRVNLGLITLVQMGSALKYLEDHKIIHRDVKPDNIFYDFKAETGSYYHLYLSDFGLSNEAENARTDGGTKLFMAPETKSEKQTPKMDIWSLFATVVWVRNSGSFRTHFKTGSSRRIIQRFLAEMAKSPEYALFADMGRLDPNERMSASRLVTLLQNLEMDFENPDTCFGMNLAEDFAQLGLETDYSADGLSNIQERTTDMTEICPEGDYSVANQSPDNYPTYSEAEMSAPRSNMNGMSIFSAEAFEGTEFYPQTYQSDPYQNGHLGDTYGLPGEHPVPIELMYGGDDNASENSASRTQNKGKGKATGKGTKRK